MRKFKKIYHNWYTVIDSLGSSDHPTSPNANLCNAYSYENAQWFRETRYYPSRCDAFRTLFGYMPSPENTMSFDSKHVAMCFRRKRAEVTNFSM
jgi:hypothetical protein